MTPAPIDYSLLRSLLEGPLLINDLPEASSLPRSHLALPKTTLPLNLQQKLGHLYEDALSILLQGSPSLELLDKNLQIRKDIHTTVGELDFLLREKATETLIHLELATKFYLAVDTPTGLALPGPDARDNYFRKLSRLREHQLTLPSRFRDYLPEAYRNEPIQTQQLIYGCLFDHINADQPARPEFINPNCRRGSWLHEHEVSNYFPRSTTFHLIPKFLWPVPFEFLDKIPLNPWLPGESLDYCVMIRATDDPIPYFIAPDSYTSTLITRPR
ncbi:DUF1853 family protein [Akkermansiaceae bacterium]|nr:DUF1853 family protein [Akkermansiaceae bacterium]